MIKQKAKSIHSEIKETDKKFTTSEGWLQRFKKRFGIQFLKISGEKLSSQPELIDPFKKQLKNKMQKLGITLDQRYNADETGLYWKLLPDKTFVSYAEKTAPGRKTEKQRITTNNNIIGKAANPRSFKNFTCSLDYEHSKTAWMTTYIFKKWFHHSFVPQVTRFLSNKELPIKALLLLDNAPSHLNEEELKSEDEQIVTMFLPPNVTPLIQPTDQNVIRLTKLYYRNRLLADVIAKNTEMSEDDDDELPFSVLKRRWNDDRAGLISKSCNLLNTLAPQVRDLSLQFKSVIAYVIYVYL
ncbi:jerky protein homolog-like [Euwallacea similis]|uniref:jerky protein homolog-like n=1 Tax=Euwallacea similis TaxID=1736056 RepID=UPI00344FFF66